MSALPGVLILGPSGSGRHSFADALAGLIDTNFLRERRSFRSVACGSGSGSNLKSAVVGLDTRYYEATVEIHLQHVPDACCVGGEDGELAEVLSRTQAVIFAFDASNIASFTDMQTYVENMKEFSFETVLCVANKADLAKQVCSPVEQEKRQQWCRSNMIEYVEVDSLNGPKSAAAAGLEKVDIHRVVEALHVTMWRNMKRKPNPMDAISTAEKETVEAAARENAAKAVPIEAGQNEIPEVSTHLPNTQQDKKTDDLDDLFRLVDEMKSVRDMGKDMSDEDRRQAAADMALKLLEKLNLSEDVEEEDALT